jgi:DNA-binding MarR family transcriptional regulator
MADPADGLCSDIQAALGALVAQQRLGRSHEVVELDIPVGQLKALFMLWTAGKPQTMGQIAQALGVTLGSVTGLIDGLVERDLVRRDEDPADRRQKLARLTARAQARLRRMERARSVVGSRLLRRMSLDDLRALRQGLVALATAAGASVPARSSTHRSEKEL